MRWRGLCSHLTQCSSGADLYNRGAFVRGDGVPVLQMDTIMSFANTSSLPLNGLTRHQLIRDLLDRESPVANSLRQFVRSDSPAIRDVLETFFNGYAAYYQSGNVNDQYYRANRYLYLLTRGELDKATGRFLAQAFPPLPIDVTSTLFQGDADRLEDIVDALNTDGVYIFSKPIDAAFMARVTAAVNNGNAILDNRRFVPEPYGEAARYRRIHGLERELIRIPEMVTIAGDPLILAAAQRYFGCQPIIDTLASYRTNAKPPGGYHRDGKDSAQEYHFDYHYSRWLKLFVYFNDIGPENGPHHFVRTSHNQRPDTLWRDGRIPDEEIAACYGEDRIAKVTGPAGTAFLADTSAFHKGFEPAQGYRALGEFVYTNTLFGGSSPMEYDQRKDGALLLEKALSYGPRCAMRQLLPYA